MAMSKKALREWPWNNQPSKLHRWKFIRMTEHTGAVESCERCGSHFIERADTRGAVYCYPTPDWLAEHPDDNGKTG